MTYFLSDGGSFSIQANIHQWGNYRSHVCSHPRCGWNHRSHSASSGSLSILHQLLSGHNMHQRELYHQGRLYRHCLFFDRLWKAHYISWLLKEKNQIFVGLITCIRERAWNQASFPLLVNLFIYLFFFVLLCEFTDLLVAMGHVLMCEIKTSWVEEFGVTWANKVVKKKIESAESKLSSGNDICSFKPDVERNQAKNRRVKLLVTRVHVTACNIIIEPCVWVLWSFIQAALRWVPWTEENTKNHDCLRQVSVLLQVNVPS